VAELASAMQSHGFGKGDRCAIVASNSVDTLKAFLATTSLGGIFSSSSTDMGTKGVLDRLVQIEPKVGYSDSLSENTK
jgi:acetoacetyl-CoA synthetase